MGTRRKYIKRTTQRVVAVRLDLQTSGFTYHKWGAEQRCKRGDWIVDNAGDVYTIDANSFAETYEQESPGVYKKVAPVWAEQADEDGIIETKEGTTAYQAGDYLASNKEDGQDSYAIPRDDFEKMYVPINDDR